MPYEEFLQASDLARVDFYRSLGELSDDVLTPLVNPVFTGGVEWQGLREGWRVVRWPESILILSDGLSDPFEEPDEQNAGLEIELVAETADSLSEQLESIWSMKSRSSARNTVVLGN